MIHDQIKNLTPEEEAEFKVFEVTLKDKQKHLPVDFQQVLHENLWDLLVKD